MKRLLSALLLLVFLTQAIPVGALAAAGKVMTNEALELAYALTGFGEGAGTFHSGMRPSAGWNAAQLSDWLDDRLSRDVHTIGDTL